MMKKLFLLLFLTLFPSIALAVAYNSNGTGGGNWSVAASWAPVGVPGAADTVTILAGDTITIDGNIAVGNSPVNDTTYNIDISGNLIWPQSPAGNWTFSAHSTIRLNGTGKFYIGCSPGSPNDRLNCANTAIVEFQTGVTTKYDLRIEGASAQLFARGCEGYPANAAGTETRARITACNPDCNAGANRILTLDTAVNWAATVSGNPATVSSNPEVIIGSGGNLTPPGGWNAEIAEIDLYPAANQVRVTNLANNHQIGDMIVNPTKNILFTISSPAHHSSIYCLNPSGQTLKPFMMSWVRLDELGDAQWSATQNGAAIGIELNAATDNFGTVEYTWITNCYDGGNVFCMYVIEGDWDSFDWNGVHDPGAGGYGIYHTTNRFGKTITGWTAIDIGGAGIPTGYGYYTPSPPNKAFDQFWTSCTGYGYYGGTQGFSNSIFHHTYRNAINALVGYTSERHIPQLYQNNEFRNIEWTGITTAASKNWVVNNDFDNIKDSCVYYDMGTQTPSSIYSKGNTFDNCNSDDTAGVLEGGVRLHMYGGHYYSTEDSFGAADLNHRNNISIRHASLVANNEEFRVIVNDAVYKDPAVPTTIYPFTFYYGATPWQDKIAREEQTYVTMHNQDQVEGVMFGFGPGGMILERVTGVGPAGGWVDNTVNLKIIPFAADRYCGVSLGKVHVASGDTLTVNLQIQKNQAAGAGRRPRLLSAE